MGRMHLGMCGFDLLQGGGGLVNIRPFLVGVFNVEEDKPFVEHPC